MDEGEAGRGVRACMDACVRACDRCLCPCAWMRAVVGRIHNSAPVTWSLTTTLCSWCPRIAAALLKSFAVTKQHNNTRTQEHTYTPPHPQWHVNDHRVEHVVQHAAAALLQSFAVTKQQTNTRTQEQTHIHTTTPARANDRLVGHVVHAPFNDQLVWATCAGTAATML